MAHFRLFAVSAVTRDSAAVAPYGISRRMAFRAVWHLRRQAFGGLVAGVVVAGVVVAGVVVAGVVIAGVVIDLRR